MVRKRVKVKKLKLATPPKLPKLPKNGYAGVSKCGNKFRGATPRKTHYTQTKDTAVAAAAALANQEWAPAKISADAALLKRAPKKRKACATGARIFFLLSPATALICSSLFAVAAVLTADPDAPADPRLTYVAPATPKPLSPPGVVCTTDGWGWPRPVVVSVGPLLTIEQADTLMRMGRQLAMAQLMSPE